MGLLIFYFIFQSILANFRLPFLALLKFVLIEFCLSPTDSSQISGGFYLVSVPSGARNNRLSENLFYYSVSYPWLSFLESDSSLMVQSAKRSL